MSDQSLSRRTNACEGLVTRWIRRRRIAWLRRKALGLQRQSHGYGGGVWGVFAANACRREAREMALRADALEASLRYPPNTDRGDVMAYEERVQQLAEDHRHTPPDKLAPRDAITSAGPGGLGPLTVKGTPEVLWCDVWDRIQELRVTT